MGALVRIETNRQIDDRERQSVVPANQPVIIGLSAHVAKAWQAAYQAKQPIELRMLRCLRQRKGIYEPEELADIRQQGGSEIFMMLTQAKCRAAEAWIRDVLLQQGDNPWGIEPTPIATLPDPVMEIIEQQMLAEAQMLEQEMPLQWFDKRLQFLQARAKARLQELAKMAAQGMQLRIEDQMKEGRWRDAFSAILYDFVTLPFCMMKGPVVRQRKRLKWDGSMSGMWNAIIAPALVMEFNRVNPMDIYPSAASRDVNDGYLIEHHRLHRRSIAAMRGVPGYNTEAIDKVLEQYGRGGLKNWLFGDQQRAELEGRQLEQWDTEGTIDAIQFWGSVQGRWLSEWGMPARNIDPNAEYDVECWKIGTEVVRAVLNPHPLGVRPYHKACWEPQPDAFCGSALPEIISDSQRMCNAAARAVSNNLSMSSGPLVEVHTDRLATGENPNGLWPWRLYQTKSSQFGSNDPAVKFHNVPNYAQPLMAVFDRFERQADNESGVPSYSYGDTHQGGAGKTASGLSMLMNNAARGIKRAIAEIDEKIVEPCVVELYNHNMQHDPDQSIKGDLQVVARGAVALLVKEQQQIRRNELLQTTANPLDAQIMGMEGRAELLRENLRAADMDADKIIPPPEQREIEAQAMAAAGIQPGGAQPPGPQTLDAAGNPASGQDAALFNQ
jgi:hypothetical protein